MSDRVRTLDLDAEFWLHPWVICELWWPRNGSCKFQAYTAVLCLVQDYTVQGTSPVFLFISTPLLVKVMLFVCLYVCVTLKLSVREPNAVCIFLSTHSLHFSKHTGAHIFCIHIKIIRSWVQICSLLIWCHTKSLCSGWIPSSFLYVANYYMNLLCSQNGRLTEIFSRMISSVRGVDTQACLVRSTVTHNSVILWAMCVCPRERVTSALL